MHVLIDDEREWQHQRQHQRILGQLAMTNTAANNAPSQSCNQFNNVSITKYYYNVICLSSSDRQ